MGLVGGMKGLFGKRRRTSAAPMTFSVPVADTSRDESTGKPDARNGVQLPRFRAMATDQLDRKRSDRFGLVRMKLRGAFTPSQPVVDRQMFSGRAELLSSMIRSIEDQRLHLVLYGERGIGKTSMLHILAEAAREARYIVAYLSCGTASDFQDTFRGAAEEVPVLFHSGFAPTTSDAELGSSLASLLPDGNFTPRQFAEVCAKLTGTRVLIILDEFDRAASADFRRDVSELMKFLSDRSMRVQLIVAGVAGDLAALIENTPSIRRNLLAVRVPLMTDTEIQGLVANGERMSSMVFERSARDLVVAMAHGSPYLASLICHHAGLVAIDEGRMTVSPSDAVLALDRGLDEIVNRLARPTVAQVERLVDEGFGSQLAAIAGVSLRAGGEFGFDDLKADVPEADFAACKRLVEKLSGERVMLEHVDDQYRKGYAFIEEGVRQYLWFLGARAEVQANTKQIRRAAVSGA